MPRIANDTGSGAAIAVAVTEDVKLSVEPNGAEMLTNSDSENSPGTEASTAFAGSEKPSDTEEEGAQETGSKASFAGGQARDLRLEVQGVGRRPARTFLKDEWAVRPSS